ncbi:hypothetical protein V8G54_017790 [Vigna mungo]|uniref:F-box domain-containing protein n=1 Tax=Vigna mungo TaxID=3915 RepID=A0AAQ3NML0_VIGMU
MELLPEDMIMEILLKLNVKSLVRCKSVCKSWLFLISDSHFKKLHFDLSAATEKFMFVSKRKLLTIDFNASLHHDSSCVHFKVPRKIFHPHYFKFGGSCRGFLVLESWKHKYLWNPCTGFYKQVLIFTVMIENMQRFSRSELISGRKLNLSICPSHPVTRRIIAQAEF